MQKSNISGDLVRLWYRRKIEAGITGSMISEFRDSLIRSIKDYEAGRYMQFDTIKEMLADMDDHSE